MEQREYNVSENNRYTHIADDFIVEGHDGLTAEQNKEIVDGYVRDRITARGHGAQWATWGHRVREGSKKSRVHFHIWTSVGPMLENGKLSDTETDWFFDEEQDAWEKA